MATLDAVTRPKLHSPTRTALDAQPIPRLKSHTVREEGRFALSDAKVAVTWLNAAKASREKASYERVALIRHQLREFRENRALLEEYGPEPGLWAAAWRELEEQRSLVNAGKQGRRVDFPGPRKDPDSADYRRLLRDMQRLHTALNRALYRYAFRPRVTYFVAADFLHGGMVPDDNRRCFRMKIDHQTTISEGDAVLSLVRLDLVGDIEKVRLCENCSERWFVAHKNFRFCSGNSCREDSYAKDPKYLRRKAYNQRAYRTRLKTRGSQW
jgi:hypothetical protein